MKFSKKKKHVIKLTSQAFESTEGSLLDSVKYQQSST